MIITISDYCKKRGVTRQFVYAYIKSGRFEAIELPSFAEYQGEKVEIGVQKFIIVPKELEPKGSDIITHTMDIDTLSFIAENVKLKESYREVLEIQDSEKRAEAAQEFHKMVETLPEPQKSEMLLAMDEAGIKLMQHMKKTLQEMQDAQNYLRFEHEEELTAILKG